MRRAWLFALFTRAFAQRRHIYLKRSLIGQRSEFLIERGMLDLVVDRRELKATLEKTIRFMSSSLPQAGEPVRHSAQRDGG